MANFLKSLFVKGIEIDPAGATSAQVLSYNGTKFVPAAAAAGGSSVTVSDTAPVSPTAGDVWYESDTGILFVRYDSYWVEVGGAGSSTTATTSATDLTSGTLNNARLPAAATTITSVGTLGSLTVTNATTSGSYLQGTDYLSPYQGFRNKIINGDFSIWQRGTGSTALAATASTSFLADRWSGYRATSDSTQTQISSGLAGFQYALRIRRNSGSATNKIYIGQSFETSSIATFAGKTMVVSFYARAGSNFSAASSLFTLNVYSGTGTECNVVYVAPTGLTTDLSTTFTLTTSWQRFSASYNVPSSVTQHGLQFDFLPVGSAGGNDYVDITGMQLEQGSVATPFEYRPYSVELGLCQRYYHKNIKVMLVCRSGGFNNSYASQIFFVTEMRASPTITTYSGENFGGTAGQATWYQSSTGTAAGISAEVTNTLGYGIYRSGTSTSELVIFSYKAEAEL